MLHAYAQLQGLFQCCKLLQPPTLQASKASASVTSRVICPAAADSSWMPERMLEACCSSSSAAAITLWFSSSTSPAQRLEKEAGQQQGGAV